MSSGGKREKSGRGNSKNAQHLLNFITPTRTVGGGSSSHHFSYNHHSDPMSSPPIRPARVTAQEAKRAYMLQNFQFVISGDAIDSGRLDAALEDADKMPPWDSITNVIVHETFDDYVCPVCLDPPCATRMTACGHIFCFPCIIRHLKQQKEKGAPQNCPMCQAIVVKNALKSTLCVIKGPIQVSSSVPPSSKERPGADTRPHSGFTLIHRERRSCIYLVGRPEEASRPLCEATLGELKQQAASRPQKYGGLTPYCVAVSHRLLPAYGDPDGVFCRFQRETADLVELVRLQHVRELLERYENVRELPRPLADDDSAETIALESCLEWLERGCGNLHSLSPGSSLVLSHQGSATGAGMTSSPEPQLPQQQPHQQQLLTRRAGAASGGAELPNGPMFHELYRLSDGQEAYLHFLNVKMLKEDALRRWQQRQEEEEELGGNAKGNTDGEGEVAACGQKKKTKGDEEKLQTPLTLCVPVLNVETVTQTFHTRQCFKPLGHVPLHSSFQLCFADLSSIVLPETIAAFRDAIECRQARLAELQARDDAAAEAMERQSWERYKSNTTLGEYFQGGFSSDGGGMLQQDRKLSDEWGIGMSPEPRPVDHLPSLEAANGGGGGPSLPPIDLLPPSAVHASDATAEQKQRKGDQQQQQQQEQADDAAGPTPQRSSWANKLKTVGPMPTLGDWASKASSQKAIMLRIRVRSKKDRTLNGHGWSCVKS